MRESNAGLYGIGNPLKKTSPALKRKLSQFYTPEELVEMTALIAFQNMSTTFNNAFDIEPQGFCRLS